VSGDPIGPARDRRADRFERFGIKPPHGSRPELVVGRFVLQLLERFGG
jgi:hypothetical protein